MEVDSQVFGHPIHVGYITIKPVQSVGKLPVALIVNAFGEPLRDWPVNIPPDTLNHTRDMAVRGYLAVSVEHDVLRSQAYLDNNNRCSIGVLNDVFQRNADYLQAVLHAVAADPAADMQHIVIVANGAASLDALALATRRIDGLRAVVNVAGGASIRNCAIGELVNAMLAIYGAQGTVPSLWLYADNDGYLDQATVNGMLQAYTQAGGNAHADFLHLDGERPILLLTSTIGRSLMLPRIDAFLKQLGLPGTQEKDIDALTARLGGESHRALAREYLQAPCEKALVASTAGDWLGYEVNAEFPSKAKNLALARCQNSAAGRTCHVIMQNNAFQ
jgi:dienelactone hydrolase